MSPESLREKPAAPAEPGMLFRSVNERIRELVASWASTYDFVCECLDERCFVPVAMTAPEFDAVCADVDIYIVAPGHERPGADEVIQASGHYTLVSRRASHG